MKRAVVVSGGGAKGGFSAGVLDALSRKGVTFDILVGTSVGSLNIAIPPDRIVSLWESIKSNYDVYFPRWEFFQSPMSCSSLYDPSPLRRLIEKNLNPAWLLTKEFRFVATDLSTGTSCVLTQRDNILTSLMASTALPGLFPPVLLDGRVLVDGGLTANIAISVAVEMGADEIVIIAHDPPSSGKRMMRQDPSGFATSIRAVEIALHQNVEWAMKWATDIEQMRWTLRDVPPESRPHLPSFHTHVIRPSSPLKSSSNLLTFRPTCILDDIEAGRKSATATSLCRN